MGKASPPDLSGQRKLTPFTCPDCGGALWEVEEASLDQYECHVGHRFGSEALKALDDAHTENVLWTAVRALQENSMLRRRMAAHATSRGLHTMARRWLRDAERFGKNSRAIRQLIETMNGIGDDESVARKSTGRAPASRRAGAPRKPARRRRQRKSR